MTENDYSFLRPGLRWAREKLGQDKNGRGKWCIVKISGTFPFLKSEIVYNPFSDKIYTDTDQPDRWEFGPEIEIPPSLAITLTSTQFIK